MNIEIVMSDTFKNWAINVRDRLAWRAEMGNLGDVKSVGHDVSEMRIYTGKGYRVYFSYQGERMNLLLCGGDKGSQSRGINKTKKLLADWED